MGAEANLKDLSIQLPPPFKATGMFQPLVVSGGLGYIAGHGPMLSDGKMMTGRIGADLDAEAGVLAARQTGLSILATLKAELGSLDRVKRVLKSLVMVNCTPDFTQHPWVADGFSRLFAEIFGADRGVGVRSAVGMGSLPFGIPVEVECVIELEATNTR
jgi:enamine deaminase RidA (YjgF/YER057c/UK114 family)